MIIYPAIDIIGGKCVRLTQGNYAKVKVYRDDPLETAIEFEKSGAVYIHVVDLEGARAARPVNLETVARIVSGVSVPVQLGGGIRTMKDIQEALGLGVARVIMGTAAMKDITLVEKAIGLFGDAIAVAVDARNGMVAVSGWEENSGTDVLQFALDIEKTGARTVVYTDILRDGMLSGPNFDGVRMMAEAVNMVVIAAGGITSKDDIMKLMKAGAGGAIIGKAIYTGDIDLKEAVQITEG